MKTAFHNVKGKSLHEKYIDRSIRMETPAFDKITSVLRGLSSRTKRREIKRLINNIAENASDEDDRLIDIIVNCLNKLPPQERLGDDVGEAELIGTYLDPILGPIFQDPENNRQFRWLNTGVQDTESQRPDGNLFQLEQRRVQFSTGYVEVKHDKTRAQTRKIHEDTLRLVNFCKDTIDKQNVESMIYVQVVGYYVSIYLTSLEANGLYLMVELFSFNVPKCISELPPFAMNLNQLKQVMLSHKTHCIFSNENRTSKKRSSIQQVSLHEIINVKKPKKLRPSLAFK